MNQDFSAQGKGSSKNESSKQSPYVDGLSVNRFVFDRVADPNRFGPYLRLFQSLKDKTDTAVAKPYEDTQEIRVNQKPIGRLISDESGPRQIYFYEVKGLWEKIGREEEMEELQRQKH